LRTVFVPWQALAQKILYNKGKMVNTNVDRVHRENQYRKRVSA